MTAIRCATTKTERRDRGIRKGFLQSFPTCSVSERRIELINYTEIIIHSGVEHPHKWHKRAKRNILLQMYVRFLLIILINFHLNNNSLHDLEPIAYLHNSLYIGVWRCWQNRRNKERGLRWSEYVIVVFMSTDLYTSLDYNLLWPNCLTGAERNGRSWQHLWQLRELTNRTTQ